MQCQFVKVQTSDFKSTRESDKLLLWLHRLQSSGIVMVTALTWVGVHWCSVASGRRSGRSCWTTCSCSPLQQQEPDTPEPAEPRGPGEGGRRLAEYGRGEADVGMSPSSAPCRRTEGTHTLKTDVRSLQLNLNTFKISLVSSLSSKILGPRI